MKNWIRRFISPPNPQQSLFFKSPISALEFAAITFDCKIKDGVFLPVFVLNVEGEFAKIQYPTNNGITEGFAVFPSQVQYPAAYINCLCMAQFAPIDGQMPAALICSEIDTEYSPTKGWKIKRHMV